MAGGPTVDHWNRNAARVALVIQLAFGVIAVAHAAFGPSVVSLVAASLNLRLLRELGVD